MPKAVFEGYIKKLIGPSLRHLYERQLSIVVTETHLMNAHEDARAGLGWDRPIRRRVRITIEPIEAIEEASSSIPGSTTGSSSAPRPVAE